MIKHGYTITYPMCEKHNGWDCVFFICKWLACTNQFINSSMVGAHRKRNALDGCLSIVGQWAMRCASREGTADRAQAAPLKVSSVCTRRERGRDCKRAPPPAVRATGSAA